MTPSSTTREQIVHAADGLFYRHGYEHTSFADIADAVGISRGNFYHHFPTKDAILAAVLERRVTRTAEKLEAWEQASEHPAERIRSFIDMLFAGRGKLKRYGCPAGTLCAELAKLGHASQVQAHAVLSLFEAWLARQFAALGRNDAGELARHLLARSQGIASLANAFHDDTFVEREVALLHQWLRGYLPRRPKSARRHAADVLGAQFKRVRSAGRKGIVA